MKHFFIVNPMAGSGDSIDKLRDAIEALEADTCVYVSEGVQAATDYVRSICEKYSEPIRFYACGGDGTAKGVAEGLLGFDHASMSIYPIGSGNDFVKYFGGADGFLDLDKLILAGDEKTDIIHITDDEGDNTYSLNVCNFGFEAYVASVMDKVRRKPLIGGKNAYTTGIVAAIFKAMKTRGKIYVDGELVNESGVYILGTAANGGYVGGGYNCAPRADVCDGLLEVCIIRPITIFTLVRLIGTYKSGGHLEDPRFKKYITYRRAKCVEVKGESDFPICLDGEIVYTKHFKAEIEKSAIRFAAPNIKVKEKC